MHLLKAAANPNPIKPEEYKRLCDKGYIHDNKVQIMTCKYSSDSVQNGFDFIKKIISKNITVSDEIKEYCLDFDKRNYEYKKDKYPEHIHPIVKHYSTSVLSNGTFIPYLIEEMLGRGMLDPLTELQKKNVFSILAFTD